MFVVLDWLGCAAIHEVPEQASALSYFADTYYGARFVIAMLTRQKAANTDYDGSDMPPVVQWSDGAVAAQMFILNGKMKRSSLTSLRRSGVAGYAGVRRQSVEALRSLPYRVAATAAAAVSGQRLEAF